MLQRLLEELDRHDFIDTTTLAEKLEVSPALLSLMANQLCQIGYLEAAQAENCSPEGCSSCASAKGCLIKAPGRSWFLSEKGKNYLVMVRQK